PPAFKRTTSLPSRRSSSFRASAPRGDLDEPFSKGPRRPTELAPRLVPRKGPVAGHRGRLTQGAERRGAHREARGRPTGDAAEPLGQVDARRGSAGLAGECLEPCAQRDVLGAEDVLLTVAPALRDADDALGTVVDVDEAQEHVGGDAGAEIAASHPV